MSGKTGKNAAKMSNSLVGASIVGVITESLYDKPIVVFREYIQNAADSFSAAGAAGAEKLAAHIWRDGDNLCFLDNGTGIAEGAFLDKMTQIANSEKHKQKNIGYKGIGRLAGLSYCRNLVFINIIDYEAGKLQKYRIDKEKYDEIQRTEEFREMSFENLMGKIGAEETIDKAELDCHIQGHEDLFVSRSTGFLVVLKGISAVLESVLENDIYERLGWLLPVPFQREFKEDATAQKLVHFLEQEQSVAGDVVVPARAYCIFFEGEQIQRPIKSNMLRTYFCASKLEQYAVCVHSFSDKGIVINRQNPFSGIRIYIDNMLLCDENELIPALEQYGFLRHGLYETIQTVRGIGALIYIVDKVNISANARRTFIDVTDSFAIELLQLMGEFVNSVYETRYALSGYYAALRRDDVSRERLESKRSKAEATMQSLARAEIHIEEDELPKDFEHLSTPEQKAIVRKKISRTIDQEIKKYMLQVERHDINTCVEDFKVWLIANKQA